MRDEDKTKEQLIAELVELRRELAGMGKIPHTPGRLEESGPDFVRGMGTGEILIEMGYITSSQLQRAIQKQKESDTLRHRRLGEALVGLGFVTREEKNKALTEQRRRLGHPARPQHVSTGYGENPPYPWEELGRETDRMKDDDRTKGQLIAELVKLRRRVAEMGKEIREFEESEIDYMRGARIGEILIEMEYLTFSQLHRTLKKQKESDILRHKRLGEIMIEEGLITIEERDSALVEQQRRLQRQA